MSDVNTGTSRASKTFFYIGLVSGAVSVIVTILNWIAPQTFTVNNIDANAFSGATTIIAAIAFLVGLWLALHILRDDLAVFSKKVENDLDRFSKEIKQDTSTGENILGLLESSGFLSREIITIQKPKILADFNNIFQRAVTIKAYNPPLDLLVDEKDHRSVIMNVLNNDSSKYQIIAGPSCEKRLGKLKAEWIRDLDGKLQVGTRDLYLSRMEIFIYSHDHDLHTKVDEWINKSEDLRGLCFFLIDNGTDKSVLMYILGKPFVESFDVPSTAILINSSDELFPLYTEMEREYDIKWGTLRGLFKRGEKNIARYMTLNKFDIETPTDRIK